MRLYREILKDEPGVAVPRPIPELSTRPLLTMTWLDGEPILNITKAPLAARTRIAPRMFRSWYVAFYYYGVIPGDPHLGNYTGASCPSVNLSDFGRRRILPPAL